ncbi:MAG TPA: glutamate synthase subunit alpha, partial [Gammaproteobacteria bacterium]|nr:glutamate synthase subunit alpha [Gammaproteobacteria bacterium]
NFFRFLASEVREQLALLGFRSLDEIIGRVDLIDADTAVDHWKARGLDFSAILHKPDMGPDVPTRCVGQQDHGIDRSLDVTQLLPLCRETIESGAPIEIELPIRNIHRTVGTVLGSEVTRRHGAGGLPDDTIRVHFRGSAGMSFGAFLPRGITLALEGDANDYTGKGLSGGRIHVYPPRESTFRPEENVLVGNAVLYGATGGEAFFRGIAGERFAVRNSGAMTVVEGVGDHGCEYMTGGRVVVLGHTGRNFAAGMSGGVAFVHDPEGRFPARCNRQMVDLEQADERDLAELKEMLQRHQIATGSTVAQRLLADWPAAAGDFVKVMPRDYKRVLQAIERARASGVPEDAAVMEAVNG